ncbi:LA_2272 family surface repeat-containing protein [Candidatus Avelusimicrobium luingense]|uniref:LA_2272 family surface repeat-containing protein n=1 Tax=Candidatus Avelusimicrobium luingense TaxID=3416211 RepID=UPI003D1412FE
MKKVAVLLAVLFAAAPVFAGDKGILKLSLWNDIAVAIPNNTQTVRGIDVGIGSNTDSVYGFQWDLLIGKVGELRGINTALGVAKVNEGFGINDAWIYARSNEFYGIQGAIVDINDNHFGGAQFGIVNFAHGKLIGAQLGFYNQVEDLHGVQLGFVNNARHISKGLQVGLVNIAKNGWFPVMVIVNGRF